MGNRPFWMRGAMLLVLGVLGSLGSASAQSNNARVRIIHAVQDMPPVDILIDGQRILSNVPFPAIGNYLDVPPGKHQVAVVPTGQDAAAALLTATPTFEAGKAYSVAAVGLKNVDMKVYTDSLSAPPAGKAYARVILLSPDAPGADIEVINGPTLVTNLAFAEATSYLEVDPGTYNLRLVANGENTVIVHLPNTTFDADKIYTVVAAGHLANIKVIATAETPTMTAPGEHDGAQTALPETGMPTRSTPSLLWASLFAIMGGLLLKQKAYTRRTNH